MNNLFKSFDTYNLRARVSVGIVLFVPLLFSTYLLLPHIPNISFTTVIIIMIFGMCNLMILLSRSRSYTSEKECFPKLLPAQQMLLPTDSSIDTITKQRYYEFLCSHIENISFSGEYKTVEQACISSINWLISQTRDSEKFPLIYEENINYGFAKNLYSLKPVGITISSLFIALEMLIIHLQCVCTIRIELFNPVNMTMAIGICVITLLMWIFMINKNLVIESGKKYAYALLSSCDSGLL